MDQLDDVGLTGRAPRVDPAAGPTPGAPLRGIRVIDLSTSYAGPFASMILGDMGADVIKVEKPGSGDDARHWGPPFVATQSAWFVSTNRNKRSLILDLTREEGREVLADLLEDSHVLIGNVKPSKLHKLGLYPTEVRARWPWLVYCALTGFGFEGPDRDLPGYDLIAQARSGLMSVNGSHRLDPQRISTPLSDVATGLVSALAIVSALRAAESSGEGTFIDTSLLDTDLALLGPRIAAYLAGEPEPQPSGATDSVLAVYQTFATADRPIVIAIGNDPMWQRLCAVLELPKLGENPVYATNAGRRTARKEIVSVIQERLMESSAATWLDRLRSVAVPASLVQSLSEVLKDPQVAGRDAVHWLDDPIAGQMGVVARPWRTDATDEPEPRSAPGLGEHGRELLTELGYSEERIDALVAAGVTWMTC
jgi:crotonobetainyl-CoA:carnitine CoA-transferase CaiB-like acyl-CoA transferase